ncbi:hypothetical protein ACKKBG_A19580 [Auxenochlorella protothecoides x Auxenochlorella symbiontica]|uniref:Mitogen-activated protein kinase kinase kinase 1 n=1 Tax=Auxenochlorella protothecoides TaxID=3075 RepID=A0A1D2ACE6_AUXPR
MVRRKAPGPETIDLTQESPTGAPAVQASASADTVLPSAEELADSTKPRIRRSRRVKKEKESFEEPDGPGSGFCDVSTVVTEPASTSAASTSKEIKPAKRQRKNDAKKDEEKRIDCAGRTVRFCASPSIKVKERMARASESSGHRLFLIERKRVDAGGNGVPEVGPSSRADPAAEEQDEGNASLAEEFAVLGATGNVYSVTICRQPTCTCPDFLKGNLCKHILFVMLRVLGLKSSDPLVWQRALLTDEVKAVLSSAPCCTAAPMANAAVQASFRAMSGSQGPAEVSQESGLAPGQRPVEGDCPICMEAMALGAGGAADQLTFCGVCGNNVHRGCIKLWQKHRRQAGSGASCPYCRGRWVDGLFPATSQADKGKGKYVNLTDLSSGHQGVDTSYEALYGDRAVWVYANQGLGSRREAARMWRSLGH